MELTDSARSRLTEIRDNLKAEVYGLDGNSNIEEDVFFLVNLVDELFIKFNIKIGWDQAWLEAIQKKIAERGMGSAPGDCSQTPRR